jgi:hypothetical protein
MPETSSRKLHGLTCLINSHKNTEVDFITVPILQVRKVRNMLNNLPWVTFAGLKPQQI